jgi:hypothetical protein
MDPAALARLPIALRPRRDGDALVARIAHVDHFGNLITNIGPQVAQVALTNPLARITLAQREISARATYFAAGPLDEPFFLQDSSGALAIALRDGSAAQVLGARRGDEVVVRGVAEAATDAVGETGERG